MGQLICNTITEYLSDPDEEEELVTPPVIPAKPLPNRFRALMDAIEPHPTRDAQPEGANQAEDQSLEERFQVRITAHTDQNAEIKTRGKHLVKKVLAAVCKTFGLDYDRLVLHILGATKAVVLTDRYSFSCYL